MQRFAIERDSTVQKDCNAALIIEQESEKLPGVEDLEGNVINKQEFKDSEGGIRQGDEMDKDGNIVWQSSVGATNENKFKKLTDFLTPKKMRGKAEKYR